MSLLTKYKLNDFYSLEVCSKLDSNSLNGDNFTAEKRWVIEEPSVGDNDFPTYTTEAAKKFNLTIKNHTPLEAIQQILVYAYTGKEKKLRDMWFKIMN